MQRDHRKRVEKLEAKAYGRLPMTDKNLVEAAMAIRAGGKVPRDWENMLTPKHLCDLADMLEFDEAHPMPPIRLPRSTDPGFDYRNPKANPPHTEDEIRAIRDWSAAYDEFMQRRASAQG